MTHYSITSRKEKLVSWIESLNDKTILQKLESLKTEIENSPGKIEENQEDYTLPGNPMTEEEFTARILRAKEEVAKGNFISHDDLEREIKNW